MKPDQTTPDQEKQETYEQTKSGTKKLLPTLRQGVLLFDASAFSSSFGFSVISLSKACKRPPSSSLAAALGNILPVFLV
jgi:hypothetical protein